MRVVSLVPSLTETLLELGVTPIACTRFCEQPTIAHVGGTKDPDIEAIVALAPDLVVMDREENRLADAEALRGLGVVVHATHVASVGDVDPMVRTLAVLVQATANLEAVGELATAAVQRTAFVAIWRRPWMTISAATYGSSLLASIGFANVFAGAADAYPTVTLDDVAGRAPQMILLPSEPYPFRQRHVDELRAAVPAARVLLVDGQDLFWWGARTAGARRRLAQTLSASGV